MRIIADTHCHTIASTHAYSTWMENIHAAKEAGLSYLAITDHGPTMPGSPGRWYFKNLKIIPRQVEGVFLLTGVECNVVDFDGTIDYVEDEHKNLDWVIASIHSSTLLTKEAPTVESCTNAWLQIAKDPRVCVIGHCGQPKFKFDYERVIPEFGRGGKLVEINNNSFHVRRDAVINCREIALLCKKHGVRVIVNTDSHFATQVGHAGLALKMLDEIGFPEELVVNSSVERFRQYLKERNIHWEE